MKMSHPRSAFEGPTPLPEAVALRSVQACAGTLGAALLSPSRGRRQRPGQAGSAVALEKAAEIVVAGNAG